LPSKIKFTFPEFNNTTEKVRSKATYSFQKFPLSLEVYKTAFEKVKAEILSGNSFLLNLTFATEIKTDLTLANFFNMAKSRYKLLVDDEFVVFSPESFVQICNGNIYSYPMKGTISATEPDAKSKILSDFKETAEHNTIVDLIRNDLSQVASNVKVKRFRYIDRVETNAGGIFQVSSEIEGKLPENYCKKIGDIIFKLLPAGSVTGAPKTKTVEIINSVEPIKRGYYTGIFGYFANGLLDSAVMIRFVEHRENKIWFRSGGGITHISKLENEYNELIEKVYVPFV
jgi:para-aminobenzoate synthetase component 1